MSDLPTPEDVARDVLRFLEDGSGYVSPHALLDLIRSRDEAVRADERARVLAEFGWETCTHHAMSGCPGVERRLVGPWQPVDGD